MSRRICALLLSAVVGLLLAGAISADEPGDASVTLRPGSNVVTWSGSEPYAIANFAGTPVRKVHRFDAVRQKWLSRVVGQDEASLPELHLLPRVQYLLVSGATHELMIPDPAADIDPQANLRFPSTPDDLLRFEAYWPNEDSPLEDLVVLRGEDERLSVEAWVDAATGDVSVWWAIDGRINHAGLASDDVELVPGGHDHGRLYAVSESGQVAVVKLPRVVRLPELELPEMLYGVAAKLPRGPIDKWSWADLDPYTWETVSEALSLIRDAGLQLVRLGMNWEIAQPTPATTNERVLDQYQRLFAMLEERGLVTMPIVYTGSPRWVNGCGITQAPCWAPPAYDAKEVQAWGRILASRFPEIRYWQVSNEVNLTFYRLGRDPYLYVDHLKAIALGIWYENPDAVIISAGIAPGHCTGARQDLCSEDGEEFLEQMYEAGFGPYHDVNGMHYPRAFQWKRYFERYLAVMARYGDRDRPIWVTEMGDPNEDDAVEQGRVIVEELEWLASRSEVRAAIIYSFRDDGDSPSGLARHPYANGFDLKPSYWAVRELLTGQPSPLNC